MTTAGKCVGKAMPWVPSSSMAENGSPLSGKQLFRKIGDPRCEAEKHVIVDLAASAMDEFLRMAQVVEPLWLPVSINGNIHYILNEDEYFGAFPKAPAPRRPGFRWEATRDSAMVMMHYTDLIAILMNASEWSTLFCGIVAKAISIEMLFTSSARSYDRALELMNVELQMITPFVPSRETCMARLCRQQGEGIWAVVDVSLDLMHANLPVNYRKRPSGCLIQQLSNGFSKITWIEHVEVEETNLDRIYLPVINSGVAFGAKYWLSILQRHCERIVCSVGYEFAPNDVNIMEGRKSMLNLAERMVISFFSRAGQSMGNSWTSLSRRGNYEVKVRTHKSINDPGHPLSVAISVATTIGLHASPKRVFDFLRNENNRARWDMYMKGAEVFKMANITTSIEEAGNNVELLLVNDNTGNQKNMLILQESFAYPTGFFIVYATINAAAMTNVLEGGNTNDVPLLPSGFAILPDVSGSGGPSGTLLTVAFQVMAGSPKSKVSLSELATIDAYIRSTIESIRGAFVETLTP